MKILWFCNTPCGALEKLTGQKVTGGGWLYSLSEYIKDVDDVDLNIAFYWGVPLDPFVFNGITYHPVFRQGYSSKLGRIVNRYKMSNGKVAPKAELERLVQIAKSVSPDVIHIHGSEDNFGCIADLYDACPIVLSVQGLLSPIFSKFYTGFSKNELKVSEGLVSKLIASGITQNEKTLAHKAALERTIFRNINNIIGRTFWDESCSLALNPSRKYYKVGEILRPEFYNAQWLKKSYSNPIRLVSTISSGIYKGLESIYYTAKVLRTAGLDFEWSVIGSSSKSLEAKLSRKLVKSTERDLGINLLGRKNASQMIDILLESDIYVQVSHIENSPNSLCEAMLLGMPIIASFAGGTASILGNNNEGWLVQDGDPYVMAGTIIEVSRDHGEANRRATNARSKARQRHNPESIIDDLLNVYKQVIKR